MSGIEHTHPREAGHALHIQFRKIYAQCEWTAGVQVQVNGDALNILRYTSYAARIVRESMLGWLPALNIDIAYYYIFFIIIYI